MSTDPNIWGTFWVSVWVGIGLLIGLVIIGLKISYDKAKKRIKRRRYW